MMDVVLPDAMVLVVMLSHTTVVHPTVSDVMVCDVMASE